MRHPIASVMFVLATSVTAGACVSGPAAGAGAATPGVNPSLISATELSANAEGSAYEVVRRLRPMWVGSRGATSFGGGGSTMLSIDGGSVRALNELDQIPVSQVREMRLLSATDAAQRFGSSSKGSAVIVVTRK